VQRCPWLDVKVGQRLHVTEERYATYRDAVFEYVTDILKKLTEVYGKSTGFNDPSASGSAEPHEDLQSGH
jgi:hypothetical protein